MISFSNKGDFSKTIKYLNRPVRNTILNALTQYGKEGVDTLSKSTPIDSGATASQWTYEVSDKNGKLTISWKNTNIINGTSIAIILQYGHATQNGGWIEGRDYINPAIKPVFDRIADKVWKEVNKI